MLSSKDLLKVLEMYKTNKIKEKPIGGYTSKYEEHIFELARASHIEVYNLCISKVNQHGDDDISSLLVSLMSDVGDNIKVATRKNMKDGKLILERKRILQDSSEDKSKTEKISAIKAKISAWSAVKTLVNEFQSNLAKKSMG